MQDSQKEVRQKGSMWKLHSPRTSSSVSLLCSSSPQGALYSNLEPISGTYGAWELPVEMEEGRQTLDRATAASNLELDNEAVPDSPDGLIHPEIVQEDGLLDVEAQEQENMLDVELQFDGHQQEDGDDVVDPAPLSREEESLIEASRSPERSVNEEDIKEEPHDIKREPEEDSLEDVMADEGARENPIDVEMTDVEEHDLPPRNYSCVEVDAGDGVAFCTEFKICKSTAEFFTFVSSLVPPDIEAVHSSDVIGSVMVRFANPTKLDTNKMRVYRQRGGPTIMRLNEQLNAEMENGDPGLKFIVEWQRGNDG